MPDEPTREQVERALENAMNGSAAPSEAEVMDALMGDVRNGIYNVRWDDDTGQAQFSLTRKGKAKAIKLINELAAGEES